MKKIYKITGFDCPACASMIELDLEDAGIKCSCSYTKSIIEIDGPHDTKKVIEIVEKSGCSVSPIEN